MISFLREETEVKCVDVDAFKAVKMKYDGMLASLQWEKSATISRKTVLPCSFWPALAQSSECPSRYRRLAQSILVLAQSSVSRIKLCQAWNKQGRNMYPQKGCVKLLSRPETPQRMPLRSCPQLNLTSLLTHGKTRKEKSCAAIDKPCSLDAHPHAQVPSGACKLAAMASH